MKNNNLIYTPKGVPIGEPIIRADGTFVLRLKKGEKMDEVSIDYIISALVDKLTRQK